MMLIRILKAFSRPKIFYRGVFSFCSTAASSDSVESDFDATILEYLTKLKKEFTYCNKKNMNITHSDISGEQLKRIGYLERLMPLLEKRETSINSLLTLEQMFNSSADEQLRKLAQIERRETYSIFQQVEQEILALLTPPDSAELAESTSGIILEVAAGVGGQEANLFTENLFRMYQNYANFRSWQFDPLDHNDETKTAAGYRHATAAISGPDVYKRLRFEGGIHRVQRVPATEMKGRIHTSTASVAILPQPIDIRIVIDEKDLRVDVFRSTGRGGQNVNKTESAVRLTHLPTGIAIENQTERSQQQNRSIAMKRLSAVLFQRQVGERTTEEQRRRKLQVGNKERSEKIRTYNYQVDRLTDHRVKKSFSNVLNILNGGEAFDNVIEALLKHNEKERLYELISDYNNNSENNIYGEEMLPITNKNS